MYNYKHILSIVLLVTVPLVFGVAPSLAQNQTTLTIKDGRVLVNGKQLDEDQIPRSLETEDLFVSLSFPAQIAPTFELNGRYYTIQEGELEEVNRRDFPEDETTVVFRNLPPQGAEAASDTERSYAENNQSVAYSRQALSSPVGNRYNALMQEYIYEVSKRDQQLYQQLVVELELERETREIANQARNLPDGQERNEKIEQLRALLGEIFDLKQENRQEEIKQLEQQLDILKQNLADREAMKSRIIDNRINELLTTPY